MENISLVQKERRKGGKEGGRYAPGTGNEDTRPA